MSLLQAILLGIVQGLTEFIPISSTAHLVLASRVMNLGLSSEQLTASIAVIQLGTLIAVFFYFAGDIWNITRAFVRDHLRLLRGRHDDFNRTIPGSGLSHEARLGWLVIRVWESDVLKSAEVAAGRIARVVSSRRGLHGA